MTHTKQQHETSSKICTGEWATLEISWYGPTATQPDANTYYWFISVDGQVKVEDFADDFETAKAEGSKCLAEMV